MVLGGGATTGAHAGGGDMKRSHSLDTFLIDGPMVVVLTYLCLRLCSSCHNNLCRSANRVSEAV